MSEPGAPEVREALAACRRSFLAVGLFSLAENLLTLTAPLFSFQMFDRVMMSRSEDTLLYLTLLALGALAVLGLLDGFRAQVLGRIGLWLDAKLGGPVFAAGIHQALRGEDRSAQGLRDLGQLRGFLTGPGATVIFDAPTVPVYLAVIFLIHPSLGWIASIGAATLFALTLLNVLVTRKPLALANATSIVALNRTQAQVRNADVIAAMGMMPALVRRWQAEIGRLARLQVRAQDRIGALAAVSKFVRLGLQVVSMAAGTLLAIEGHITGGMMIAASIISARGLAPIEGVIGAWQGMVNARAAYERMSKALVKNPRVSEAMAMPPPAGRVTVDRVVYVPAGGGRPILKGVSFEIEPGESLGVIGPTAAGKSTLGRLIVGAWPATGGSVRLDGANVITWAREDFGRHVGYLPQDVQLFAGTVAENIARMGEVTSEAVVAAAVLAGVHDLILHLPMGYETPIEEGGIQLSGGQRQRIALARALYGEPRLVVLDEPNSNLDTSGEEALLEALSGLKERHATVVLITHRPNILRLMDRILVLKDGLVETWGPRDEVLGKLVRSIRGSGAITQIAANSDRS